MKSKELLKITVILVMSSSVIPVMAEISFYSDRSHWQTQVAGEIVTETFDEVAPGDLLEGINAAGLIDIEMANLSEINSWNSINNGTDAEDFLAIDGTPFYQGGCRLTDPDTIITLHFPSAIRAFGADFKSTHSSSYGNGLVLLVNGVEYYFQQLLPDDDGSGFLGIISPTEITTVMLYAPENNETFGMDNVSFVIIPEPTTIVLLGLGGLVLPKRRKV